jgi:hypothetical protein
MAQHYQWPGMAHEVHMYVTQCGVCYTKDRRATQPPKAGNQTNQASTRQSRPHAHPEKTSSRTTQYMHDSNTTRRCAVCQRVKPTRQPRPPIQPLQVPAKPFSQITLDWIGGFPHNIEGNDAVLIIVDKFTKWAIVIPCNKEMNALKLAELLYQSLFSWVRLPLSIVGDRDSRLTSSYMRTLCKHLRVKLKLSTSYHPQTDGQTENFNSTLLQMLRCFVNQFHTDWCEHIPALLYAYQKNTVHSATGYPPHRLLFGWCPRDLRTPLQEDRTQGDSDVDLWLQIRQKELSKAMEAAREAMIRARRAAGKHHE